MRRMSRADALVLYAQQRMTVIGLGIVLALASKPAAAEPAGAGCRG